MAFASTFPPPRLPETRPAAVMMAFAPSCPGTLPLAAVTVITTASTPSRRSAAICSHGSIGNLEFCRENEVTAVK